MENLFRKPIFYIFIIGLLLRLILLDSNPAGFFRDEAAKGYNAYCIYQTGKDIDGNRLPIYTRELATYNSALYSYLIIPFILIFGLSELAVRLPATLFGSITILSLYWVVKKVYSEKLAIISSILLTFSPWHILFSRWANQGILLPCILVLSLGCFLKFIQESESKQFSIWLPLSLFILSIGFYTYDIGKIFIPLFLLGLLILYKKELLNRKSNLILSLILFFMIALPMIQYTYHSDTISQARFQRISLFSQSENIIDFSTQFFGNWLSHFSPGFLFLYGDTNIRHSIPWSGQLYLFELPLFFMGLYTLWKGKEKFNKFLFYWLILYPIPASLTTEGIPHALRAIVGIPVIAIISSMGLLKIIDYFQIDLNGILNPKKKIIVGLVTFIIIFNIIFVFYSFYTIYPSQSAEEFQYGMKEAVEYSESVKEKYSKIIISPSIGFADTFFLFYTKYPPARLSEISKEKWLFNRNINQIQGYLQNPESRVLLLVKPYELTEFHPIYMIYDPKGKPILKFVENQKGS